MRVLVLNPRIEGSTWRELYFCDGGTHDRPEPALLAVEASNHRIGLCRACARGLVTELGAQCTERGR